MVFLLPFGRTVTGETPEQMIERAYAVMKEDPEEIWQRAAPVLKVAATQDQTAASSMADSYLRTNGLLDSSSDD